MLVSNAVSLIRHLHQRCKLTTWRHQPLHKEYWICVIILLFYNNSYVNICSPNTSLNGMHLWQPAGGTVRGVQQLLGPVVPSVYNSLVKVCFLNFYRFRLLVFEKKNRLENPIGTSKLTVSGKCFKTCDPQRPHRLALTNCTQRSWGKQNFIKIKKKSTSQKIL